MTILITESERVEMEETLKVINNAVREFSSGVPVDVPEMIRVLDRSIDQADRFKDLLISRFLQMK